MPPLKADLPVCGQCPRKVPIPGWHGDSELSCSAGLKCAGARVVNPP